METAGKTFSHHDPSPCQWFSRLAALDRRSTPRLILLFLGTVLARGRRTVPSRAAADGIAEGREAQPLGEHAAGGDRPNFGAEHPGHGLTSGRLALGSHASSGVAFTGRTRCKAARVFRSSQTNKPSTRCKRCSACGWDKLRCNDSRMVSKAGAGCTMRVSMRDLRRGWGE